MLDRVWKECSLEDPLMVCFPHPVPFPVLEENEPLNNSLSSLLSHPAAEPTIEGDRLWRGLLKIL